MSFQSAFKFLTLATALWAFFLLAVSAALHWPGILLFLLAFALVTNRRRLNLSMPQYLEVIISLSALVLALYGWMVMGERMYSVIYLFLYLEIYKLWSADKNRDYLQIYALTFFQVLAASVSTSSILFAPGLLVYLFLILAAMITITIKSDAEIALLPKRKRIPEGPAEPVRVHAADQRRLERLFRTPYLVPSFYRWLGVALVFITAVGMGIFFIIPRMEAQSLLSGFGAGAGSRMQSGFSDGVEFSSVGEIQNDPTIAMRAIPERGYKLADGRPDIDILRLRGTALDHYNGRRWAKSESIQNSIRSLKSSEYRFGRSPAFEKTEFSVTRILLEPNRKGFIFGPDRPFNFRFDSSVDLAADEYSGSVQYTARNWSDTLSYSVTSAEPRADWANAVSGAQEQVTPQDIGRALRRLISVSREAGGNLVSPQQENARAASIPAEYERLYLQLPEHPDIETVQQVAGEWVGTESNPRQIAETIELRLQTQFEYSLENDFSDQQNHLSIFLTDERSGHCEYFATAMALMLRTQGIPARIVNGYATDEWSSVSGGYYIVRQEHAHSWVEAYFPNAGWITFDPTPGSGIGRLRIGDTLYRRITAWIDGVKFLWYKTIIDYDMNDQRFLYYFMFRSINFITSPSEWFGDSVQQTVGRNGRLFLVGMIAVAVAILAYFLYREFQKLKKKAGKSTGRRRGARVGHDESLKPYIDLLKELDRLRKRDDALTPLEYAWTVTSQHPALSDFVPLTRSYYEARYNGHVWTDAESSRAKALVAALPEEISRMKTGRNPERLSS